MRKWDFYDWIGLGLGIAVTILVIAFVWGTIYVWRNVPNGDKPSGNTARQGDFIQ